MDKGNSMNIKKNLILGSIVILCAGVVYVNLPSIFACSVKKQDDSVLRIGIFQPATHPALDEIAQGFIDAMQIDTDSIYQFDRFNGNGNKILMQAQAQEMLQAEYDLIFTIGVGCSVTIKDLCQKKGSQVPVVFTAVDDPENLDLYGPTITGVIDQSNYGHQLSLACKICPNIKRLLLVYDQSQASGLEKDKNEIRSILQKYGIELVCVEIVNISEIQQKVTGFIESVDLVMILKDNTVVSGIDSLISLCNRYHIPLLASDLNSGIKGAALAYGIYEAESGTYAAHQAKRILQDGTSPAQLPVIGIKNMKMHINCQYAFLQGLTIDCQDFSMPHVELDQKGNDHV